MHYYIIDNLVKGFSKELDSSIYSNKKLDSNQSNFYELNRTASLEEILECRLNIKTIEECRIEYYEKIKLCYLNKISEGYYDSILNIRILLEDVDRNQFVSLLIQIDNLDKLGNPLSSVNILDYYSNMQTLGIIDYRGLISRYGDYYIKVWGTKTYIENLVTNSQNESELESINIKEIFKNIK